MTDRSGPRARHDQTAAVLRRPPPPLGVTVRVHGARCSQTELELGKGRERCVLGAGDADIIIEDKGVSRRHAELTLVPEGVCVRDLGSRNGTFYLGQRIEKAVLSPGSRIRLGNVEVSLEADLSSLPDRGEDDGYRGLIGVSEPMRRLFAVLSRLEGSLVNVLVEGPSGVGKELIARAIHEGSQVAAGPLVVVNCGAIGRDLVLSELFGHKKGAFTGASEQRIGAFEAADGGTLFLDEIGELPLELQPALLRALESGEVKPLGENEVRHVDVRVVAATNRDLTAEVQAGGFREDLFYRLAVVRLAVPPLAERHDDVPVLAAAFAEQAGVRELPASFIDALAQRSWPGNARELRNAVLAYVAIGTLPDAQRPSSSGGVLEAAVREAIDASATYQDEKDRFVALFSRIYLDELLKRAGGNQSEAARQAGIERSYFGKLLSKYGLR